MKEAKISVIVPIYNVEKYLKKCVQSIVNQSYRELEIILVDDGSTDNSYSICNDFSSVDVRIKVLHKVNGGLVSARKEGLKAATGEYIGFVDGDDYIEQDFYHSLYRVIKDTNADIVHTGYSRDSDEGTDQVIPFTTKELELNEHNRLKLVSALLHSESKGDKVTQSIWSKLFKAEIIKENYNKVPDTLTYGEDLIAFLHCVYNANKLSLTEGAGYHYVRRENSITNKNSVDSIAKIWLQYSELKKIYRQYGIYDVLKNDLEEFYVEFTLGIVKKMNSEKVNIYFYSDIERIRGKKIVIYGAGDVGRDYYAQLSKYMDISIVAWVDKNYEKFNYNYMQIESVENLYEKEFDYIIIAINSQSIKQKVRKELVSRKIPEQKII